MKKVLLTFGLALTFLTMLGQDQLMETSTSKLLIELPGFAPSTMSAKIAWKVYQDSIVMSYVDKKMLRRLEKSGDSPVTVYSFPLNKEGDIYTYQGEDIRVRLVRTSTTDVITVTGKDNFTGEITKVMYY